MIFTNIKEGYPTMSQQNQLLRVYKEREKFENKEIRPKNEYIRGSIERTHTENKKRLEETEKKHVLPEITEKKAINNLDKIRDREVRIEPKFEIRSELNAYKENAWDKLEETSLGKKYLDHVGGKETVKNNMQMGLKPFLTKTANVCERFKECRPAEEGNVVHKVAELYYLERQPAKILDGKKYVEQSIHYKKGKNSYRKELDYVSVKKDGSVLILDYKRFDMTKFERTVEGRRWAIWAKKHVGPNYRELIREGSGPYFSRVGKELPPADVREGLKVYTERLEKKHQKQLDRYRRLFSEGSGIPLEKITTAVAPYYVYGKSR